MPLGNTTIGLCAAQHTGFMLTKATKILSYI